MCGVHCALVSMVSALFRDSNKQGSMTGSAKWSSIPCSELGVVLPPSPALDCHAGPWPCSLLANPVRIMTTMSAFVLLQTSARLDTALGVFEACPGSTSNQCSGVFPSMKATQWPEDDVRPS
jgi:hypothetical protein